MDKTTLENLGVIAARFSVIGELLHKINHGRGDGDEAGAVRADMECARKRGRYKGAVDQIARDAVEKVFSSRNTEYLYDSLVDTRDDLAASRSRSVLDDVISAVSSAEYNGFSTIVQARNIMVDAIKQVNQLYAPFIEAEYKKQLDKALHNDIENFTYVLREIGAYPGLLGDIVDSGECSVDDDKNDKPTQQNDATKSTG